MFRFRNLPYVKVNSDLINRNVEPRLNQIMIPLASVVEEEVFRKDLYALIEQYQREVVTDRATRWEAEVLAALLQLHDTMTEEFFTMKEIAEVVNENREVDSIQISPRMVGAVYGSGHQCRHGR